MGTITLRHPDCADDLEVDYDYQAGTPGRLTGPLDDVTHWALLPDGPQEAACATS